MEDEIDNLPTGLNHDPNVDGVIDHDTNPHHHSHRLDDGRHGERKPTKNSHATDAKNSSGKNSEGIIEKKVTQEEMPNLVGHKEASDSHPTLQPLNAGSKTRFQVDQSGGAANLQVKTPTHDHRTATLGYNPFRQGSHTVLNSMGNQKASASNMGLSFGVDKQTPTLQSPVQRSSDKLPEAKALLVPVPPYQDVEDRLQAGNGRAHSAIKKKVPTLSESRFKKKSHLKMMAEVVEYATMASEGGGKAVPSDTLPKGRGYPNTHGYNTHSGQGQLHSADKARPELFLKRPRADENPIKKIDHEAIRNHANSWMVHQIESDLAREQRRKQFLEDWRRNELHANKSRSQEIASSYRRLYREHLEKSLEYKANASIGKAMTPDGVRERLANRGKYAEMVRQITKNSPKPANQENSRNSVNKNDTSGPARTIFEAIERQRKRSQDTNKNRHLLGNEYMKFAIKKAKEDSILNKSTDSKPKPENLQEYAPVRQASAQKSRELYNIHQIFQSKEPLGLESAHYARLENIRKADGFKSAQSKAAAVGAIKSIDQELAKKEKLGQQGEQLDRDYLRSIHTKLEVLGVEQGLVPKKYTPLGFKAATQRVQSAVGQGVDSRAESKGARPPGTERGYLALKGGAKRGGDKTGDKSVEKSGDKKETSPPRAVVVEGDSPKNKLIQPSNTKKELKANPTAVSMELGQVGAARQVSKESLGGKVESRVQLQPSGKAERQQPGKLGRTAAAQGSFGQLSAAEDGGAMLPATALKDPLIRGLSQDLDADPSESMRASHQAKLKKELGEFFDRQQTGSLADEARKANASQDNLDEF